jgi:hypothetical protein
MLSQAVQSLLDISGLRNCVRPHVRKKLLRSTLIETMALQDLGCGNGFALIDPHGDLVARIAARIPAAQRDRVIYLNTTDRAQPYGYIHSVTSLKNLASPMERMQVAAVVSAHP